MWFSFVPRFKIDSSLDKDSVLVDCVSCGFFLLYRLCFTKSNVLYIEPSNFLLKYGITILSTVGKRDASGGFARPLRDLDNLAWAYQIAGYSTHHQPTSTPLDLCDCLPDLIECMSHVTVMSQPESNCAEGLSSVRSRLWRNNHRQGAVRYLP